MRTSLLLFALLLAPCICDTAVAQEEPSTPPGLAIFPSAVVSSGILQLQGGTSYTHTATDETFRFGRVTLRYGVGPVELQTRLGSYVVKRGEGAHRGLEDLTIGSKIGLFRSAGGRVQVGGRGTLTVPTGAAELTSGEPNIMLSTMADLIVANGVFLSTSVDWESPHFAGDESWTFGLFPALEIPSVSGGGGVGWFGHLEDGSLDSTLLAAFFVQLDPGTALELSAGRAVEASDLFFGVRVFRLLAR